MNNNITSNTITFLRFPLIVMVVFIHFNISRKGISVHGINYGLDNPIWYYYLINFISSVVASTAVPLFFFFSGFLFFFRSEFSTKIYQHKIHSRIRSLLIPFLIWNIITIAYQMIKLLPFLSSVFPGSYKTEIHFSLIRLFNTFFNNTHCNGILVSPLEYTMTETNNEPYPIDIPLWYIRDLMILVILSPIVYWGIKKGKSSFVIILGTIWFLRGVILPNGGYISMLTMAFFFFSWGAYYSINNKNFISEMRKYIIAPFLYLPIAIADTICLYSDYSIYIHSIGIVVGILTIIICTSDMIKSKIIKPNPNLLCFVFFIFALHKIIIDDIAKIIFSALHLPGNTFVMISLYFFVPILTITICMIIYKILYLISPHFCRLLSGGR